MVYTDLQDLKKEIIKKLEKFMFDFADAYREEQEFYELIQNIKKATSVHNLNYYLEDMLFFIKEVPIKII